MQIIRGTTPTITINLEDGVKFEDLGTVTLRIKQGTFSIDKEPTTIDGSTATFDYTEEETLKLYEGAANIQLVGVKDNEITKSEVYGITVYKSLWNESVKDE